MTLTITVSREAELQSILRQELRLSSGLIRRLKFSGAFTVNGKVSHTNQRVHPGDLVQATISEPPPAFPPEDGPISILYEDDALLVVDKPQGMIVHPSFHRNTGTLANYVLGYFQRTGQPSAIHPVTRLDRDTFGVVLLAKNAHIHAILHQAQLAHMIQKTYLALVRHQPPADMGTITLPIARPDPMSIRRCVSADGQPAVTAYQLLAKGDGCSLLQLQPITGRTHQLRVHCAAIGCPIWGDPQYGEAVPDLPGQLLCATSLALTHPLSGTPLTLRSKLIHTFSPVCEKNGISCDFLLRE